MFDPYTIGTITREVFKAGGVSSGLALLAIGGIIYFWREVRAERRQRAEMYAKKDAEAAAQIAQERSAHMGFMRDLVARAEEREKGFLAFVNASTRELERISQRQEQASRDGDERHKAVMQEFKELGREVARGKPA